MSIWTFPEIHFPREVPGIIKENLDQIMTISLSTALTCLKPECLFDNNIDIVSSSEV